MPRKRMIDPEFWSDEEIGSWSFAARLFYIGLWNFADDEGRFKANDTLTKAQIFPYDTKNVSMKRLRKETASKIHYYSVKGQHYGYIRNFLKYQRIDRPTPSKLPPPELDDSSTTPREQFDPNISKDKLKEVKLREIDDKNVDNFVDNSEIHETDFEDNITRKRKEELNKQAQDLLDKAGIKPPRP